MRLFATILLAMTGVAMVDAAAQHDPASIPEGMTCTACHLTETPSEDSHALRQCARPPAVPTGKEHTVQGHTAEDAPDIVVMDKLSDLYVPVVFSHKLHASMTDMDARGCTLCHHNGEDDKIAACEDCHSRTANPANLRQPALKGAYHRQCLACHREWSHESGCIFCHAKRDPSAPIPTTPPETADMTGALHPLIEIPDTKVYKIEGNEDGPIVTFHHKEHVEDFGLKCVECHQRESCSNCHDTDNRIENHLAIMPDPHNELCGACHEKEVADNCAFCHGTEERGKFNHAQRTGFMLTLPHASLKCRQCHGEDDKRFSAQPTDCTECHGKDWPDQAKFDHAVTGVVLDETHKEIDCAECHNEGFGGRVACASCHGLDWEPGKFDHRRTGEPLDATHAELACTDCHADGLEKPATCDACHDDGRISLRAFLTPAALAEAYAAPAAAPATGSSEAQAEAPAAGSSEAQAEAPAAGSSEAQAEPAPEKPADAPAEKPAEKPAVTPAQ